MGKSRYQLDKEKLERKMARLEHRHEMRTRPTIFQEKRMELASEIISAIVSFPPRWGSLKVDRLIE